MYTRIAAETTIFFTLRSWHFFQTAHWAVAVQMDTCRMVSNVLHVPLASFRHQGNMNVQAARPTQTVSRQQARRRAVAVATMGTWVLRTVFLLIRGTPVVHVKREPILMSTPTSRRSTDILRQFTTGAFTIWAGLAGLVHLTAPAQHKVGLQPTVNVCQGTCVSHEEWHARIVLL